MEHEELKRQLHLLIDGELPPAAAREAEEHARSCAECGALVAQERQWRQAVRGAGTYYAAPDLLRQRVAAMARRQAVSAAAARRAWPGWRMAASLLLTAGLTSAITAYVTLPSSSALIEPEVVASHVRSLQMDHITDVKSSDQHTVKPWFHGKIDYAPPIEDYAAEGFPLVGGRLEYLDDRNVAALVYQHAQHPINVFILPTRAGDSAPRAEIDRGYNILRWTKGGMAFWAVSDLNATDMAELAKLLREQKPEGAEK
jgi:anti-sigma factor RsiW